MKAMIQRLQSFEVQKIGQIFMWEFLQIWSRIIDNTVNLIDAVIRGLDKRIIMHCNASWLDYQERNGVILLG